MSDDTKSALRQAFDAIEAGDLETARSILEPILAVEPDNADAWWIYSHAVSDPQSALDALENVVRVDPQYPGATELLSTLRERLPRRQAQPPPPPPPPTALPDLPSAEPEFDVDSTPSSGIEPDLEEEAESRSRLIPIAAAVLLVLVILALIYSLTSQTQSPATPTVVVAATQPLDTNPLPVTEDAGASSVDATGSPTPESLGEAATLTPLETDTAPVIVEPTETNSAAATSEPVTTETEAAPEIGATNEIAAPTVESSSAPEATIDASADASAAEQALLGGLRRYTLADEAITREETTLGNALLVSICVADRREVPTLLRPVMRAIATGTQALPDDVQAVGARMIDCATGRPFVVMAVDRQSATDHAAGTLPYVEFRQLWQPQR